MKTTTILLLALLIQPSFAENGVALFLTIDGSINPASSDYLHEGIKRAEKMNAACVVVELNTPGGLLQSTRMIVSDFLTSTVPVIVYVSPAGAQAASAGVFVTLAANVAAMAPGTNIGAAHPVNMQGGMDSTMAEKVTNDAAAFIRTISEKRHRNMQWAEEAVRKSLSITETEALKKNVIDFVARDRADLLDSLDGRKVQIGDRIVTLATRGATIESREMGWQYKILDTISDPNIAYIFMMIGMYGILFELYNPGSIFPGVAGAISLLIALYAFHTLSINYSGVALIILGIILFVLEIKITSHGLLTVGGVISLFMGSIMLINTDTLFDFQTISLEVIIPTVLLTAAFFVFAIGAGLKAQMRRPATGAEGLIGEEGVAITKLNPSGQVKIQGEMWNAESIDGDLPKETPVIVAEVNGLALKVKKRGEHGTSRTRS
ncbi:MAG TPA: nodulation protein NfeD [Bacteroidota bacterium]|nr:nodulation protein NfeD [Bacteroidota bacterium]